MEEKIHGLSMRDCAEIMSKDGELKAQHGEASYTPHLNKYLAERGVDQNTWANSWNGWWTRMQSDPSGQLHAKFATMQQGLSMKAHMADVPDASQDQKEGVTLDLYAQLMAKIAGGEDAEALLAANGLSMDQWQKAQKGWNDAMAADVNHHLTTQYGTLYAKYTPGFQANMEAQTAAIMAADYAERAAGRPDEPEVEYTFDDMLREMGDSTPDTRWSAGHHVCNTWDIGDHADPALDAAAKKAYELAHECLESHNEFTVSNAEAATSDLKMFAAEGFMTAEQASDTENAMGRCLGRARDHLENLEAAFAPIRDKAVPERITMQTAIQDYTSLIDELSETIEEWADNYSEPSAAAAPSASFTPPNTGAMQPSTPAVETGFIAVLKRIPIIGNIIRMLGL